MTDPSVPEGRFVPVVWVGLEDLPIQMANMFASQFTEDGFILSVGQAPPPLLVGPPEAVREQADRIPFVGISPIARVSLTTARVRELIAILEDNLSRFEQVGLQADGEETE